MADLVRVTGPTLDVLHALLDASYVGEALHGWAIVKKTRRTGPTVYGILDRLEDIGWIEGEWEEQNSEDRGPRRRLYHLTGSGLLRVRCLLEERRNVESEASAGTARTSPSTDPGLARDGSAP